jgi:diacylglycerol O-acyltransferase / wax synthase
MDRMGPLDAGFVEAENEDPHVSMAIASIAVFAGPPPSYDELVEMISGRLPVVPRYRQKMRSVPWRLGAPVWVDDAHFDVRYHIRETAVPAPGGEEELAQLMARVMAQRLDRDRPLWEDWMVTGLAGGRWALISKIHHCMVDGVSGTDLYRVIFDTGAGDVPSLAAAAPEPSSFELFRRGAVDTALIPLRGAHAATRLLVRPRRLRAEARNVARAVTKAATTVTPAPRSSLTGPIGAQRRFWWAEVPLEDVRTVKQKLGGTVNDVVLAAITAGFRDLLLSRGEEPKAGMVPSLVPVSLRAPGEEDIYENRVSAMILHLPVHLSDPTEQLEVLRTQAAELKRAGEPLAGQVAVSLMAYMPYFLSSLTRFWFRIPQREIVTVTTNVPGPRTTLYCLGRPLETIIPYVPISSTMRIGVAIFSYRDRITFGITGDYDQAPDLPVLANGIVDGVTTLVKAANES